MTRLAFKCRHYAVAHPWSNKNNIIGPDGRHDMWSFLQFTECVHPSRSLDLDSFCYPCCVKLTLTKFEVRCPLINLIHTCRKTIAYACWPIWQFCHQSATFRSRVMNPNYAPIDRDLTFKMSTFTIKQSIYSKTPRGPRSLDIPFVNYGAYAISTLDVWSLIWSLRYMRKISNMHVNFYSFSFSSYEQAGAGQTDGPTARQTDGVQCIMWPPIGS